MNITYILVLTTLNEIDGHIVKYIITPNIIQCDLLFEKRLKFTSQFINLIQINFHLPTGIHKAYYHCVQTLLLHKFDLIYFLHYAWESNMFPQMILMWYNCLVSSRRLLSTMHDPNIMDPHTQRE